MTTKATRILKETHPLFWPWCAVALAGALPLAYPMGWTAVIYVIGFFMVPVMATLALGDEFQHHTLSLLLSQPIGLMRIWGEKLSVTVIAVVSAVLLFSLALRATTFRPDRQELTLAVAWIVAITTSATFWTLFTRSSVGGVAVNIVVQSILIVMVPWASLAEWLRAKGYLSPVNMIVFPTVAICAYAGVMLWLSGRMLARFQATGGMAGDDLLTAGPDVMPGVLTDWLRCRPSGVVLNLIRKELRLLRPVWLISLLAAAGWACLTLFGLLYERGYSRNFETAEMIMGVISTLMILILAGSMSLGEEKTSGTHAWQLTLPVSAARQWFVKLAVALFAGLVGAILLPMLTVGVGGCILRSSHMKGGWHIGSGQLLALLAVVELTFAAFWCACALDGTVGAVLWVFPVAIALGAADYFANRFAPDILNFLYSSRFNPYADLRFAWKMAKLVNGPGRAHHYEYWLYLMVAPVSRLMLVGVPVLLLALIQSYRLFRTQIQGSTRTLARNLAPLVVLAFLCGFALTAFSSFLTYPGGVWWMFGETGWRIQKIIAQGTNADGTHPLQLTVDDLAAVEFPEKNVHAPSLSEAERRWLRGARIIVIPDPAHPHAFYCWEGYGGRKWCYYSATIHLPDGTDLTQSWEPKPNNSGPLRYSVYAHWPGTEGRDYLSDWVADVKRK